MSLRRLLDHVTSQGHQLSFYNHQSVWCTGHDQTMIEAYDFIHSTVPEINPYAFSGSSNQHVIDPVKIR